jgi:hypothetical protein
MDWKESKPLIADKFTRPLFLLWVMVLPQILLLIFNYSSWTLVNGEMSAIQKQMSFEIFGFEAAVFAAGLICIAIFQFIKKAVPLLVCVALFLINIGYLWLITSWLYKLLPASVTIWIFTPDEALYYQYIFMMPVIFYTGLRLSCIRLPISKVKDISITVATLVVVPLCSYFFMHILFMIEKAWNIPSLILTILFVGATIITMVAFIRILVYIYLWLNNYKAGHLVLLLIVGLAAPLAGLALNSTIPFPCDFQSLSVYVLAVINGLVLLISFQEGTKREVFAWFLRCLLYPFSLYFFLVFLPFLPLSLLAIIAMGSGFLILAPVALFIVHTRKLFDEGKRVANLLGLKGALLLFAIGFAVMPSVIAVRASLDRHALIKAIDAVYNPDYAQPTIGIKPESVKHSLLKLREMKEGIFLPFISTFYNKVVFNGMVLPDYKMNEMYLMVFGEDMPKSGSSDSFNFSGRMNFRNQPITMPERNVEISNLKVKEKQEGEFIRADIELTLNNRGEAQSEFVTDIQLGQGVLVSGYWLNINGEKVSGRIFEKKTAMWIYHMIRDVARRDPGLLIYKSDNVLKLSVYPFVKDEQRLTGIELLYPAGMKPVVKIDGKFLDIGSNPAQEPKKLLVAKSSNNTSILVPNGVLMALPAVRRKPYLHFIVDSSASAKNSFASFGAKMVKLAAGFTSAAECKITLANYESTDLTNECVSVDQIEKMMVSIPEKSISFKGAFCYERAIKQKLLEYDSMLVKDFKDEFSVPIYIIVKSPNSKTIIIGDMSAFERFVPDTEAYYFIKDNDTLFAKKNGREESIVSEIAVPEPVVLFKSGNLIRACAKNSGWGFIDLSNDTEIQIYDPNEKKFKSINEIVQLDSNTPYTQGLAALERYRKTIYSPQILNDELPEIVKISKDCGVMNPLTSYIVVENSAQSKMLERKEQQKLNSNQALEFDEFMESPAPPIVFLMPFAFVLLTMKRMRNNI